MLYESLIKLTTLKSVKWYDFIGKYKNVKLLTRTLKEIKNLVSLSVDDTNLASKIIDFMLGVDALDNLVNSSLFGIHIYRGKRITQVCPVSTDCFYVDIKGTILDYLSMLINVTDKTIEVKYTVHNNHEDDFRDVFYINEGKALGDYSTAAVRKFVISELQFVIDRYIKGVSKELFDMYT